MAKTPEEMAQEINSSIEAIKTDLAKAVNKEDFSALKTQLEELKQENNDLQLKATLEDLTEKVNQLREKTTTDEANKKTLVQELKENIDSIKSIASGTKNKEVVVKALTNRASIANNEQAFDLTDIGQLATRKLSLYDIFPKLRVSGSNHNGVIRYYDWDEATIARAAAMVAEGTTFPESTAKWKKGSIDIQKIGDTLVCTDEFLEDEQMFAAELGLFLETNVKLEEDNQLANGDGTGNNLTGLLASIDAYVPAPSGIADASVYDLAVKVHEDISVVGGAKYMPDVLIAPQSVINTMKLKKDANNNYVMPPFVSQDGNVVDGLRVIESNIIPANTLVIGDRRFGRIYEMDGYVMSEGYSGTQFLEDEKTIKIRKRLAFLIREADKGGFRKVTDVAAALVTLAT